MKRSSELPSHCTGQAAAAGEQGEGVEQQQQRQLSAGGSSTRPLLSSVDESSLEEALMMPSAPHQPEQPQGASSLTDQAATTVLASSFKDKMKLVGGSTSKRARLGS